MKKKNEISEVVKIYTTQAFTIALSVIFVVMFFSKGGYFKQDVIGSSVLLLICLVAYICYNMYKNIKEKEMRVSFMDMAVSIYSLSYSIPVLFGNAINKGDAINTAIKYVAFASAYFCFKNVIRNSKKINFEGIFLNLFATVTTFFSILGIDELSMKLVEPLLKKIGLGYATAEYRLSSLFQYANASAIFIALGIIVTVYLCMRSKKVWSKVIYFFAIYTQIIALLLTQSRTTIIFFTLTALLTIGFIKDRLEKNKLLVQTVYAGIFSSIFYIVIYQFIKLQTRWQIILLFSISAILYMFTAYCIEMFLEVFREKLEKTKFTKIATVVSTTVVIAILLLVFSLKSSLLVDGLNKRKYKIPESTNVTLDFTVSRELNTNINVVVKFLDKNHNVILEKGYNQNSLKGETIKDNVMLDKKAKYVALECYNQNGVYYIDSLKINSKVKTLDYLLIPTEITNKILDIFNGSSSFNERITYYKDAVKFSTKNILFGTGGNTFRNTYQYFQSRSYISAEAHSYVIDILLNTGLFGLIAYFTVIIYGIYLLYTKYKKDYSLSVILAFAMLFLLVMHSALDLDFSYNIILFVFAYIIAKIPDGKDVLVKNIWYVYIPAGIIAIFTTFVGVKMFAASTLYNNAKEDVTLSAEKRMQKVRLARMLDANDLDIAIKYIAELENNKLLLKDSLSKTKYTKNILEKINDTIAEIENVAKDVYEKNKYNKKAIEEVAKVYIRNFINFGNLKNSKDYNDNLEMAFVCIENILEYGKYNANNYRLAASLADSIYRQLSYLDEKENLGLEESINRAKKIIVTLEETAKQNFQKGNLIYSNDFLGETKNIINKYI